MVTNCKRSLKSIAHILVVCAGLALGASIGWAATCTSTGTGNWNNPAIWSGCGGLVPGAADTANIANLNHTVTVTANQSVGTVNFVAGGSFPNLTINSGITMSVVNSMTVNGSTGGSGTRTVTVSADAILNVGNDLIMNGGSNNSRDTLLLLIDGASTAVNVTGDFGSSAAGANFNSTARMFITFGGQGTLRVGQNFGGVSTFTAGNGTVILNGASVTQSLPAYTYNNLTILKTGTQAATTAGVTTVSGALSVQSGVFNVTNSLTVDGATTIAGTMAITNTTGTKTFNGSFTVSTGGTWNNNTLTEPVDFNGDFTNNGTFNAGAGVYTFGGGAAQTITGTNAGTTTFADLTLNNANGLTLTGTHNVTVSNALILTNGAVTPGTDTFYVSNNTNGAISRTNGFVAGNLRWALPTAGSVTRTFPVGTGTTYSPADLVFNTVTAGDVTVRATGSDHPDVANSGIDPAASVNRYWTITNNSATFASLNATFNWIAGDLDVGANTTTFEVQRWDGAIWNSTTTASRSATSIQITGVTGVGDFVVGQPQAVANGIGRFNAYDTGTAAAAVTGNINTKVAGVPFNVDIIAIKNNRSQIDNGFTGAVVVELLNASTTGTVDASTGCDNSWTVIQTIAPNPTFVGGDSGRKTISVTENGAWKIARFRITNTPGGTLVGCSTDAFAIRPASFSVSVTDTNWSTAGTTRALDNTVATGGRVHKAGQPFTITVTPSPLSANYDTSPIIDTLTCTLPGVCVNGTLDLGTFSGGGVRTSTTATYSEAGAFNLTLFDTDFALIDKTDGTPADCSATGRFVCQSASPLAVGRFVPDRFVFSAPSTPMLLTFGNETCGSRSFTYIGQPFWYQSLMRPSATIQAVNASGTVTANYPLNTATLRPQFTESYADGSSPVTLNVASIGTPAATSGSGTGTYTASASGQLNYDRVNPVAPFTAAISLTVSASDATDNAVDQGTITTSSSLVFNGGGPGIAFDNGAGFRFGRLRLTNASSSKLLPLRLPMETQYWDGTFYITNVSDSCTTLATTDIGLGNHVGGGTTSVSSVSAISSGRGAIILSAPSGVVNSVDVAVNLGTGGSADACPAFTPATASAANKTYLRGNWCNPPGTHTKDPSARARFGIRRGDETIYRQERFN